MTLTFFLTCELDAFVIVIVLLGKSDVILLLHRILQLFNCLARRDHPQEQERQERAAEADRDEDPVLTQVLLRDADPLIVDQGSNPAANRSSEVAHAGEEREGRRLDALRTDLRHNDRHGQEDEALRDNLADRVREDDESHVRDAPVDVQAQNEDESQGRQNYRYHCVHHDQRAVLPCLEILVEELSAD